MEFTDRPLRRYVLRARYKVIFVYHVRGRSRARRLALARYTYTTRTLYGGEDMTISLYARIANILVFSTLRDASFQSFYLEGPHNT